MVRLQSRTVMDHNIVSGCDCSLADMLRHQEEIKPEKILEYTYISSRSVCRRVSGSGQASVPNCCVPQYSG